MCGICGIVTSDFSPNEKVEMIQRMGRVMAHRGPDDEGSVNLNGVCLGMRRLSIIDPSPAGHQPMCNEDGTIWVVANGMVYNYEELRKMLLGKGHTFKSQCDIEVIVHLYEENGPDCVHQIRGMFAFAIWDDVERELFIVRDRLGIKPLYYSVPCGRFLFASEIKSIIKSGLITPELDCEALDLYLSFGYVPPPWTMLKGVSALLPGHCINVKDAQVTVSKWWDFPEEGTIECPRHELIPRVRSLMEESIRLHQVSDVPIGAFLSGGIDSTAVVGLMSQVSHRPVKTFSVGFESDVPEKFNELIHARMIARRFGTDHTEVILKGQDVVDELDNMVFHLDQPSFDGINTYFVSRAAKEGGLTVALSGLGGDELFGGYGSYQVIPRLTPYIKLWGNLPQSLRIAVAKVLEVTAGNLFQSERAAKIGRLKWIDSLSTLYALARLNLWPREKEKLLLPSVLKESGIMNGRDRSLTLLQEYANQKRGPWRMVSELELRTYMNWRLLRDTDAMSMAHSLEVRVPLIDHKIVEFVCGLSPGWQENYGYPKRLLTTALSDIIPEEILNKPKHGFEFPVESWMRKELKHIVEDTLSEYSVKKRGIFSPEGIRTLYRDFLKGKYSYPAIWQLVVLELWSRRILDRQS